MGEELDPGRIGRMGEATFQLLSEQAGLICNKSAIDQMGWDFIVEFPMTPAGLEASVPLDQRPTTAARVQLKSTVGNTGNRVRLSLSAIDRLAKDPHPALIVVFRMRKDGEVQSGYVVHLIGQELARVLKRLRLAEFRREYDINHTEISYDYEKSGRRFEPTGEGLAAALRQACGDDTAHYTIEKQRQLAELGYEDGQFEAIGSVRFEGPEHLADALLGILAVKPQNLQVFDRRFGIRLPYQGTLFDDLDNFHLTPPSVGRCEIAIRGPGLAQAARFDAEMFIGPPLPKPHGPEILVRSADFTIRLGPESVSLATTGSIDEAHRTLEEWAELLRALTLLASGRASLSISGNAHIPSVSLSVDQDFTGPYLKQIPVISKFVDGWLHLLASAGMRSTERFELDRFWKADEARMAVDIMLNQNPVARIDFPGIETVDKASPKDGLYFNNAGFADTALTYSARVFIEKSADPDWPYRSARFEALDVRPQVDDLEEYGVDQASAAEINLLFNPKNITFQFIRPATEARE